MLWPVPRCLGQQTNNYVESSVVCVYGVFNYTWCYGIQEHSHLVSRFIFLCMDWYPVAITRLKNVLTLDLKRGSIPCFVCNLTNYWDHCVGQTRLVSKTLIFLKCRYPNWYQGKEISHLRRLGCYHQLIHYAMELLKAKG